MQVGRADLCTGHGFWPFTCRAQSLCDFVNPCREGHLSFLPGVHHGCFRWVQWKSDPFPTLPQVSFNPKDTNTFASCSLDRSVKVWNLGQPNPNFTLEGHDKGVNCVDYFTGEQRRGCGAPGRERRKRPEKVARSPLPT